MNFESTNGHSEAIPDLTAGERLAAIETRLQEERTALIEEIEAEIAAHETAATGHTREAAELRRQIAGYAKPAKKPARRVNRTTDRAPAPTASVDGRSPQDTVRQYFAHNEGGVSAGVIAESTGLDRVVVSRELKKLVAAGEVASDGRNRGAKYSAAAQA